MKKEFKKIRVLVKEILETEPETRNSDSALYSKVVEKLNKSALDRPFGEVMANLKAMGLPGFETVRRTRQKIQEIDPDLKACDVVQDYRTELEETYRKEFGSC